MKTKTAEDLGLDQLYHYQSFEQPERLARIFTDNTLYFSTPRHFNDPWDCRPCFSKVGLDDPAEYERAVCWFAQSNRAVNASLPEAEHLLREREVRTNRKLLEWMIDELSAAMADAMQSRYRVYCLSTHPDSVLMWAHYANSCRGVCLEFAARNELISGAMRVEYFPNYPHFDVAATSDDAELLAFLAKSDLWGYENEFRIIATEHPHVIRSMPTSQEGFVALPAGALKSVIIGTQMPAADRQVIRDLIEGAGKNIALHVAELVRDRYAFKISPFKP